uniref:Enoyl reductase (ER) domain-containing protein n=1 Tax=Corethron hystrix TaxID=216773 RepID=A0A7S1B844_9STRA|mmetsp:Transcript_16392/g.36862  ORF Transcript_16392/g.36862 Transcript_16392/m.36862 type:complete len:550 (+) Transcript_16392:62-1711(+)
MKKFRSSSSLRNGAIDSPAPWLDSFEPGDSSKKGLDYVLVRQKNMYSPLPDMKLQSIIPQGSNINNNFSRQGSFRGNTCPPRSNSLKMRPASPSVPQMSHRQKQELSGRDMMKAPVSAPGNQVKRQRSQQSYQGDSRKDFVSSDHSVMSFQRDQGIKTNSNAFQREYRSFQAHAHKSRINQNSPQIEEDVNLPPPPEFRDPHSSNTSVFDDAFVDRVSLENDTTNVDTKQQPSDTFIPRPAQSTSSPLHSVPSYDPSFSANRTVCTEDGGVSVWSTTTFNDSYQHAKIVYNDFGSPLEVMEYVSYPHRPIPSNPNGVVIKVEASTVSRTDCFIRANKWHEVLQLPNTPGCDCIGRVFRVGVSAEKYGIKVGDRVATYDPNLGSNARYICAPSYELFKIPSDLDAAEGVCLIQTYATAYQCLNRAGERKLKRGDKVLIIGGNGAVGQACVQLAVIGGASEVYATANENHHEMLSELGAIPLSREPCDWLSVVRGSMNIVVDCVCADLFNSSWRALSWDDSKLVCVGLTAIYSKPSFFWYCSFSAMGHVQG